MVVGQASGRRNGAGAYGLGVVSFLEWTRVGRARVAVISHPSGVSRWWNDQGNARRAREFLAGVWP